MNINLEKTIALKIRIATLKIEAHYKGTCKLSQSELAKYEAFIKEHSNAKFRKEQS